MRMLLYLPGMKSVSLCDVEVDLCYSRPCLHDGQCFQKEGGYTCLCSDTFTGKFKLENYLVKLGNNKKDWVFHHTYKITDHCNQSWVWIVL